METIVFVKAKVKGKDFKNMISQISQNHENANNYDDLLVSIEANYSQLNLLIAVCDNIEFRDQIIEQYEQELAPAIPRYKIKLSPEKPSISLLINQLIAENTELKTATNAVITITGTEQFRFLFHRQDNQQSPQEELLGYFQWTREALKDFPYSIVLWVTTYLQQQLEQKSPDFWSWRKGVFRFKCPASNIVDVTNLKPHLASFTPEINQNSSSLLPLEDLQELIAKIEREQGNKTAQLANLYSDLGQVYRKRSEQGKSVNYQEEQNLAIQYLQKAIQLRKKLLGGEYPDVATSIDNLAQLYYSQGRYEEAEPLYLQALKLRRKVLGEENSYVATSLNNLAVFYHSQRRYEEAESLYLQALKLSRKLLGEEHPYVATSLNNLAALYRSQRRYQEAETLFLQALKLARKLLGEDHPNTITVIKNFEYFLQQVIEENRVSELSNDPLTRSLLKKLQSSLTQ